MKDNLKVGDEVKTELTEDSPGKFSKVLVTADSGIFKGGKSYAKDEEAVIEAGAAKRFEELGEVKILGEA